MIGAPAGLRRAVTALLDNASRHAAGEVRVIVGTEGRDVLVDVVVDGPGIFPHILAAMFDQVTRCPGGDRSADRHYGLDLALVNEVAAHHGGWLSTVHTGRPGAILRLRLPAARTLG